MFSCSYVSFVVYKMLYCMFAAGCQHMLGTVRKKLNIWYLRMMSKTSQLCRFKIPALLAFGFFIGVFINQAGFIMENIHLHVDIKSDETSSPYSTFQDLMQRLPHLNHSSAASSYVVPNIVHYFWLV